jgi:hypothetical protein
MTRRFPVLCAVVLTVVLGTASPGFAYTPHELSYADGLDVSSMNPFISTSGNAVALAELTMAEFTRFRN